MVCDWLVADGPDVVTRVFEFRLAVRDGTGATQTPTCMEIVP